MDQNIQSFDHMWNRCQKTTKTSRIRRKKPKNKPNNSCLSLIFSTHIKKSKPFRHRQKSRNHSQRLAQWENHITGSAGNRQKGCHRSVFHWWSAPFNIFWVAKIGEDFQAILPCIFVSKGLVQPPTEIFGFGSLKLQLQLDARPLPGTVTAGFRKELGWTARGWSQCRTFGGMVSLQWGTW